MKRMILMTGKMKNQKNKTMKLSQLTPAGQDIVIRRLNTEQEHWNRSSYWWESGLSHGAKEMIQWNKEFQEFQAAVLADEEIDEVFKKWGGEDLNVPQYSFR